ncbi:MAG: hypothetical protein KF760_22125 [Candidatus Eremiobacteraeota bacterium]|nr:hypothetical protein [Candidatus Eremiobacteraeota bacterium]MCW5872021.1 hypothetical protein [Candidatus Eremiobacteraeota bacterium]
MFGERLDRGIILACTVFSSVVILGLLPLAIRRYGTTPDNARYFMGFFHILLWVVVGGLAMRKWRQPLIALMRRYEGRPKSAFIAFSVLLACIEEALACLMTNLGRLFGDPTGQVYITASANYLDLAFLHSVIVIVPQVAIWSWILERYRFTSSRLFVLFGVQGGLAEIAFAGMQPALFPTWLLVYALMTWLPYQAFEPALERARIRKNPGFLIQILSLVLVQAGCILFSLAFLAISYGLFGHPLSHFPK